MRACACGLVVAVALLASACGARHHTAKLGLTDCVKAWNSTANERRARVSPRLVPGGFTQVGIQLSDTLGGVSHSPPNPVGCRVVFFNRRVWVAFLADRKGNEFRFRPAMMGAEEGDQRGRWPARSYRGPANARLLTGTKLEVRPFALLFADLFDNGHIDGRYSCAAARAAVAHLPTGGLEIGARVRDYENKVC
jgi:hypothetical protein